MTPPSPVAARVVPSPVRTPGIAAARLEPVADLAGLAAAWRALEPRGDPSFFQSWGWIGCWLRHLPPGREPLALTATRDGDGEAVVGLGLLLPHRERRHGFVTARALRLHESGDPALDSLYTEHNGLLTDARDAPAVWRAVMALFSDQAVAWDELILGGLEGRTAELCTRAARAQGLDVAVRRRQRYAYVDLEGLRRSGRGLAAGRNTRYQLARARRLYEAGGGPLALRAARTAGEALAMLDRLETLHQASWRRRGRPGCFAAPAFGAFHRDLIRRRFGRGEVQLLCATAGGAPIGYLYNFVKAGRVYAYQSGFDYAADGRLKPGLVTHALAIEGALRDGLEVYDFMAGENRLKASLATHFGEMVWLAVQRPRTAFRLERLGAGLKARLHPARPVGRPRLPWSA